MTVIIIIVPPVKSGMMQGVFNSLATIAAWQIDEVPDNYYVLGHVFANTANDLDDAHIIVMGQAAYATKALAEAGATDETAAIRGTGVLGKGIAPLYTIIYQTSDSFTNGIKAIIVSVASGEDYIDLRRTSIGGGGSTIVPAHAATHEAGAEDALKLDNLDTPDDNTDLDATITEHGLLPKLGGGTTNFLRADGTWVVPPGGAGIDAESIRTHPVEVIPDTETIYSEQLLADHDMSDPGITHWILGTVVAEKTANGHGGLAITIGVLTTVDPWVKPAVDVLVIGQTYRAKGYAVGDGTAYPSLVCNGVVVWTGTTSTTVQPYDFTFVAGAVELLLTANGAAGTGVAFDVVHVQDVREIEMSAKRLELKYFENQILHSEDFTQAEWTKVEVSILAETGVYLDDGTEMQGLVSTAIEDTHRVYNSGSSYPVIGDIITLEYVFRSGTTDWVHFLHLGGTEAYAYFNMSTFEWGTIGAGVLEYGYEDLGDGRGKACITLKTVQVSTARIYVAASGTSYTYTGDGTSVDLYASQAHTYKGYPSDNVNYIPTTTVVNTGTQEFRTVPDAHASTHLTGAGDAIDVVTTIADGLALATDKVKLDGIATGADVTADNAPQGHGTTHESGGSDAIKLDNLATPDDNTDLNATTSVHGLLPKLGSGTTNFLRADGTWAEPPSGGGTLTVACISNAMPNILTSTYAKLTLNVLETEDDSSVLLVDTVNSRITAVVACRVLFTARSSYLATTSGTYKVSTAVYLDGSLASTYPLDVVKTSVWAESGEQRTAQIPSLYLDMTAGQYLEIFAKQEGTMTIQTEFKALTVSTWV